jgi:hypothetical protein
MNMERNIVGMATRTDRPIGSPTSGFVRRERQPTTRAPEPIRPCGDGRSNDRPGVSPRPRRRIGRVFYDSRDLMRIVYRDPDLAYVDHVRKTVGVNWLGAVGAVVALSMVIASDVISGRR